MFMLWAFWYYEADSVTEHAAGTYGYHGHGQRVTVVLSSDQHFRETISFNGLTTHADGTWHTFGRGHIGFSKEFIPLSGQEICYGNETCGWLESSFGYMTMDLGLNEPGLLFRRHLF
jgi:hypothetical protein